MSIIAKKQWEVGKKSGFSNAYSAQNAWNKKVNFTFCKAIKDVVKDRGIIHSIWWRNNKFLHARFFQHLGWATFLEELRSPFLDASYITTIFFNKKYGGLFYLVGE